MKRPILYWLEQLPAGYRERAIANHEPDFSSDIIGGVGTMSHAINLMCHWRRSPEGHSFWSAVADHYEFRENSASCDYKPLPQLPTT